MQATRQQVSFVALVDCRRKRHKQRTAWRLSIDLCYGRNVEGNSSGLLSK